MRASVTKIFSLLLCLSLLLTCLPATVSAAEDYRGWSQSDSRWGSMILGDDPEATMAAVGCTSISITKLLRQAGAVDSSYTPKDFVKAMNKAGNYKLMPASNSGAMLDFSVAASEGEGFSYVGRVETTSASTIVNYVKSGYYVVVKGKTVYGDHWCAVDNAKTLSNNYLTVMNSWKNTSSNINVKWSKVFSSLSAVLLFRMKSSYTYTKIPANNYYLKNVSTGTYLSVDSDGENICVSDFTGKKSMQIKVTNTGSGNTMRPLSSSKLINPYASYVAHNVNVNLYKDVSDNTQKWYFERTDSGYLIHNKAQPHCVLGVDGDNVEMQAITGADSQLWTFELVTPKAISMEAALTETGITYTINPNFNSGICTLWLAYYENGQLRDLEMYHVDLDVVNTSGVIKDQLVVTPTQTMKLFLLDDSYTPLCEAIVLTS